MEDIEYLEEYEDFILPKTLNYSEEYQENTSETGLIEGSCNELYSISTLDAANTTSNIQQGPIEEPASRIKKGNYIKILNTEVLSTPAQIQNFRIEPSSSAYFAPIAPVITQHLRYDPPKTSFLDRVIQNPVLQRIDKCKSIATVKPTLQRPKSFVLSSIIQPHPSTDLSNQSASTFHLKPTLDVNKEDDSFLDYALAKHDVNDFNAEFNLDTAEISDICSESMNFSDEYNEDIFDFDSMLTSEESGKKKLKRKKKQAYTDEDDRKRARTGFESRFSEEIQKSGKLNVTKIFSTKSSITQLSSSKNSEKKRNRLSLEKKKLNLSGKQSKVVVKKNGKKFLFPDRSKFSLKHLNKFDHDSQHSQLQIDKPDDVSMKTKIENNAPIIQPAHTQDKDIVIFSSCSNLKRISKPTESNANDSHDALPVKTTSVAFAHFSLKSIKPPINLKIKETTTQAVESKDFNKPKDDDVNRENIESKKCDGFLDESENDPVPPEKETEEDQTPAIEQVNDQPDPVPSTGTEKETEEEQTPSMEQVTIEPTVRSIEEPSAETPNTLENDQENNKSIETENAVAMAPESPNLNKEQTTCETSVASAVTNGMDLDESLDDSEITAPASNTDLDQCTLSQKDVNPVQVPCQEPGNTSEEITPKSQPEVSGNTSEAMTTPTTQPEVQLQVSNKIKVIEIGFLKENTSPQEQSSMKENITKETNSVSSPENCPSQETVHTLAPNQLADSNDNLINAIDQFTGESLEKTSKQKSPTVDASTSLKETVLRPISFEPCSFSIRLGKNIVSRLLQSSENQKKAKEALESTNLGTPQRCASSTSTIPLPENPEAKVKTGKKRGRKKKLPVPIESVESNEKSTPPISDSTLNITATVSSPTISESSTKRTRVKKLKMNFPKEKNPVASPAMSPKTDEVAPIAIQEPTNQSAESNTTTESSKGVEKVQRRSTRPPAKKIIRTSILSLKASNQVQSTTPKTLPTPVTDSAKDKQTTPTEEPTALATPAAMPDVPAPKPVQPQPPPAAMPDVPTPKPVQPQPPPPPPPVQEDYSAKNSMAAIEIIEPKKEPDEPEQLRPSDFIISNDSLANKIKTNVSPEPCQTNAADLNSCLLEDQNASRITIFELPAFIVMKTKIVTRKDYETSKPMHPSKIKQQVETETETDDGLISESAIKTERTEFNAVCAQINALLEENANYLKFASGSERLSRMKDVLGDYSLSAEDAACTLKFMQSYLSSDPRDKAIRTRGQQFIPIYDSQKKIIGYRKRTVHVKPTSSRSRRASRASTAAQSRESASVQATGENGNVIQTKIEPDLMNVDSELILPDTSPLNDVSIKTEESIVG